MKKYPDKHISAAMDYALAQGWIAGGQSTH